MGTLDLLILARLAKGPMHGFGIAEYLHQASDTLHVEEGSLYPALHRLESQGFVESEWGVSENNRKAKYYKLTRSGRRHLEKETANWERIAGAIFNALATSS